MTEYLQNLYEAEETALQDEKFKITDLSSADWVFRKIQEEKAELEKQEAYIQEEILKYQLYLDSVRAAAASKIAHFESYLTAYIEETGEKIKTATGTASITSAIKWKYDDEKLLNYLKENKPEFIRVKEEINKSELKKALTVAGNVTVTQDGEIIDGVEIITEPKLNIRLK